MVGTSEPGSSQDPSLGGWRAATWKRLHLRRLWRSRQDVSRLRGGRTVQGEDATRANAQREGRQGGLSRRSHFGPLSRQKKEENSQEKERREGEMKGRGGEKKGRAGQKKRECNQSPKLPLFLSSQSARDHILLVSPCDHTVPYNQENSNHKRTSWYSTDWNASRFLFVLFFKSCS